MACYPPGTTGVAMTTDDNDVFAVTGQETRLHCRVQQLARRRENAEAEIAAVVSQLNATPAGVDGALVDRDGYPRADVDLVAVRRARNRLATLHADHKQLTADIERVLERVLGAERGGGGGDDALPPPEAGAPPPPPSSPAAVSAGRAPIAATPGVTRAVLPRALAAIRAAAGAARAELARDAVALVHAVYPGSPASRAGLRAGDRLVAIGPVNKYEGGGMRALGGVLADHRDAPIEVVVLRQRRRRTADENDADGVRAEEETQRERTAPRHLNGDTAGAGADADAAVFSVLTLVLTPQEWHGHGLLGAHVLPA